MNKRILSTLLSSLVLIATTSLQANATAINFNAGLNPFFTYTAVDTIGNVLAGSGYNRMVTFTGNNQNAFNPGAQSPSTFTKAGAGTFDLTSLLIDGAWGTQTLTVEGLSAGTMLFSQAVAITPNPTLVMLNWSGINQMIIVTGNDYVHDSSTGSGDGQHWVLGNVVINENAAVPEPATMSIFSLGLLGVVMARRRKANKNL